MQNDINTDSKQNIFYGNYFDSFFEYSLIDAALSSDGIKQC